MLILVSMGFRSDAKVWVANQYWEADPLSLIHQSYSDKHRLSSCWFLFPRDYSEYYNECELIYKCQWLAGVSQTCPQRHRFIFYSKKHLPYLQHSLIRIESQQSFWPCVLDRYIFVWHFIITFASCEKVHLSIEVRDHWSLQQTCT